MPPTTAPHRPLRVLSDSPVVIDKLLYKLHHLSICESKEIFDGRNQRDHDQLHRMIKGALNYLLNIQVEQFSKGSVICISLFGIH